MLKIKIIIMTLLATYLTTITVLAVQSM